VTLPLTGPILPMLAAPTKAPGVPVPDSVDGGLSYEPKWDGFRIIVFRDGDSVTLWSRNGQDLTYVFPEAVTYLAANLPDRCVVDGELVVAHDGRLWFEELGNRIRPRSEAGGWKIAELAQASPTSFIAFDLLALSDRSLMDEPNSLRRELLEESLREAAPPVFVTPNTRDHAVAGRWFVEFEGAGLDGLICRPLSLPYTPDKRILLKVKHSRTVDVVVAGWREHKTSTPEDPLVGSLLLGLYGEGALHHIGVAASFTAAKRRELAAMLAEFGVDVADHPWAAWGDAADAAANSGAGQRLPGGVSRWTGGKDLSFHPVRPSLVCEVGYDQMEGNRFRHTARFLRWRPDREPESCGYEQLDRPLSFQIDQVLAAGD
jgi:ATP-dependent DNA ligase